MTTKKQQAAPEPTPITPAVEIDEDGYVPGPNWVTVPCTWESLAPREGYKPLWAELDLSLSTADAEAIPDPTSGVQLDELYPAIAPYVRSWNVKAKNLESGRYEPVAPPLEGGPDVFRVVSPAIATWVALTLRGFLLGGGPNRKNAVSGSGSGPSGKSAAA